MAALQSRSISPLRQATRADVSVIGTGADAPRGTSQAEGQRPSPSPLQAVAARAAARSGGIDAALAALAVDADGGVRRTALTAFFAGLGELHLMAAALHDVPTLRDGVRGRYDFDAFAAGLRAAARPQHGSPASAPTDAGTGGSGGGGCTDPRVLRSPGGPAAPSPSTTTSEGVRLQRVAAGRLHSELFAAGVGGPRTLHVRPAPGGGGLGAVLAERPPALGGGVWVAQVAPDGAFERAGGTRGRITAIDGMDVAGDSFHCVVSLLAARQRAGHPFDVDIQPTLAAGGSSTSVEQPRSAPAAAHTSQAASGVPRGAPNGAVPLAVVSPPSAGPAAAPMPTPLTSPPLPLTPCVSYAVGASGVVVPGCKDREWQPMLRPAPRLAASGGDGGGSARVESSQTLLIPPEGYAGVRARSASSAATPTPHVSYAGDPPSPGEAAPHLHPGNSVDVGDGDGDGIGEESLPPTTLHRTEEEEAIVACTASSPPAYAPASLSVHSYDSRPQAASAGAGGAVRDMGSGAVCVLAGSVRLTSTTGVAGWGHGVPSLASVVSTPTSGPAGSAAAMSTSGGVGITQEGTAQPLDRVLVRTGAGAGARSGESTVPAPPRAPAPVVYTSPVHSDARTEGADAITASPPSHPRLRVEGPAPAPASSTTALDAPPPRDPAWVGHFSRMGASDTDSSVHESSPTAPLAADGGCVGEPSMRVGDHLPTSTASARAVGDASVKVRGPAAPQPPAARGSTASGAPPCDPAWAHFSRMGASDTDSSVHEFSPMAQGGLDGASPAEGHDPQSTSTSTASAEWRESFRGVADARTPPPARAPRMGAGDEDPAGGEGVSGLLLAAVEGSGGGEPAVRQVIADSEREEDHVAPGAVAGPPWPCTLEVLPMLVSGSAPTGEVEATAVADPPSRHAGAAPDASASVSALAPRAHEPFEESSVVSEHHASRASAASPEAPPSQISVAAMQRQASTASASGPVDVVPVHAPQHHRSVVDARTPTGTDGRVSQMSTRSPVEEDLQMPPVDRGHGSIADRTSIEADGASATPDAAARGVPGQPIAASLPHDAPPSCASGHSTTDSPVGALQRQLSSGSVVDRVSRASVAANEGGAGRDAPASVSDVQRQPSAASAPQDATSSLGSAHGAVAEGARGPRGHGSTASDAAEHGGVSPDAVAPVPDTGASGVQRHPSAASAPQESPPSCAPAGSRTPLSHPSTPSIADHVSKTSAVAAEVSTPSTPPSLPAAAAAPSRPASAPPGQLPCGARNDAAVDAAVVSTSAPVWATATATATAAHADIVVREREEVTTGDGGVVNVVPSSPAGSARGGGGGRRCTTRFFSSASAGSARSRSGGSSVRGRAGRAGSTATTASSSAASRSVSRASSVPSLHSPRSARSGSNCSMPVDVPREVAARLHASASGLLSIEARASAASANSRHGPAAAPRDMSMHPSAAGGDTSSVVLNRTPSVTSGHNQGGLAQAPASDSSRGGDACGAREHPPPPPPQPEGSEAGGGEAREAMVERRASLASDGRSETSSRRGAAVREDEPLGCAPLCLDSDGNAVAVAGAPDAEAGPVPDGGGAGTADEGGGQPQPLQEGGTSSPAAAGVAPDAVTPTVPSSLHTGGPGCGVPLLADAPARYTVAKRSPHEPLKCGLAAADPPFVGVWVHDVGPDGAMARAGVPEGLLVGLNGGNVDDLAMLRAGLMDLQMANKCEFEVTLIPLTVTPPEEEPMRDARRHAHTENHERRSPPGGGACVALADDPVDFAIKKTSSSEPLRCTLRAAEAPYVGAWLDAAAPGSAFARAGVPPGLIIAVNGKNVDDLEMLHTLLDAIAAAGGVVFEMTLIPTALGHHDGRSRARRAPPDNDDDRIKDETPADPACELADDPVDYVIEKRDVDEPLYASLVPAGAHVPGVLVRDVVADGPLGRAGVVPGLLISMFGAPVDDVHGLRRTLNGMRGAGVMRFPITVIPEVHAGPAVGADDDQLWGMAGGTQGTANGPPTTSGTGHAHAPDAPAVVAAAAPPSRTVSIISRSSGSRAGGGVARGMAGGAGPSSRTASLVSVASERSTGGGGRGGAGAVSAGPVAPVAALQEPADVPQPSELKPTSSHGSLPSENSGHSSRMNAPTADVDVDVAVAGFAPGSSPAASAPPDPTSHPHDAWTRRSSAGLDAAPPTACGGSGVSNTSRVTCVSGAPSLTSVAKAYADELRGGRVSQRTDGDGARALPTNVTEDGVDGTKGGGDDPPSRAQGGACGSTRASSPVASVASASWSAGAMLACMPGSDLTIPVEEVRGVPPYRSAAGSTRGGGGVVQQAYIARSPALQRHGRDGTGGRPPSSGAGAGAGGVIPDATFTPAPASAAAASPPRAPHYLGTPPRVWRAGDESGVDVACAEDSATASAVDNPAIRSASAVSAASASIDAAGVLAAVGAAVYELQLQPPLRTASLGGVSVASEALTAGGVADAVAVGAGIAAEDCPARARVARSASVESEASEALDAAALIKSLTSIDGCLEATVPSGSAAPRPLPRNESQGWLGPLGPARTYYVPLAADGEGLGGDIASYTNEGVRGVWLMGVAPGLALEAAGVPPGRITAVDGDAIEGGDFDSVLTRFAAARDAGRGLAITIRPMLASGAAPPRSQEPLLPPRVGGGGGGGSVNGKKAPPPPLAVATQEAAVAACFCVDTACRLPAATELTEELQYLIAHDAGAGASCDYTVRVDAGDGGNFGGVVATDPHRRHCGVWLIAVAQGLGLHAAGVPVGQLVTLNGHPILAEHLEHVLDAFRQARRGASPVRIGVQPARSRMHSASTNPNNGANASASPWGVFVMSEVSGSPMSPMPTQFE